jgi:hypothetical protein
MSFRREDGRLHPAAAFVLGAIALFVLVLVMRGCVFGIHEITSHTFLPGWGFGGSLLSIWGLLNIALGIWVGHDAGRKGLNGIVWGLLVFFTGIIGLLVYLLVSQILMQKNGPARPADAEASCCACPNCHASLQPEYKACPYCGIALRCPQCGSAIQGGWKVCPQCGTPLNTT